MLEFLTHVNNLPFTAAMVVMFALGLVEVAALLMGGGWGGGDSSVDLSADVGTDVGADVATDITADSPDYNPELHGHSLFHEALGWLYLGKLPMLVVMTLALFSFGFSGLMIQSIWSSVVSSDHQLLPWWVAVLPAFLLMLAGTRAAGSVMVRYMPQDETEAVHSESFVGLEATIVLGTARRGFPAQAKVKDIHGKTHYVMVEPRDDDVQLPANSRILLISAPAPGTGGEGAAAGNARGAFHAMIHPLTLAATTPPAAIEGPSASTDSVHPSTNNDVTLTKE